MNLEEQNYLDLMKNILETGDEQLDRTKTGTLSTFGSSLRFSLKDNKIPLITTKKMFAKGIIEELLFFIRGETNTKKLEEKGVNIWKGNTSREFLDSRGLTYLPEGDMGKGYGFQWRKFNADLPSKFDTTRTILETGVDQLANMVNLLKSDPYSRRIILTAWNPFQLHEMSLPPCHIIYQCYVNSEKELSAQFYMRSADCFLGIPYNFCSYAILTHLLAKLTGLKSKELIFTAGNTHIYKNHIDQVEEQITRVPYDFPTLNIKKDIKLIEDMENLSFEDFEIVDYKYHPAIKAKMSI